MYSKETVLNDSYQELSDCLQDLLKYEMIGRVPSSRGYVHLVHIDWCEVVEND